MDEEVVLLEEQITALQADVESLQSRLADAEAIASSRDADLTRLRHQLTESQSALSQRDAALASHAAEAEALRASAGTATGRYRDLILAREPDLPADLVTGETVEELDAAVERARQTVSLVRQRLEAEAQANRVPAGAPARTGVDTSALTPSEKIRLGLQQG